MKQSRTFIPTLREIPSDAEIVSHQLLLRAGFIRQHMSGVYSYLPLAKKVLRKIENIIREEMDAIEAVEVLLPTLQQTDLWEETGRWQTYGQELFRLTDRHDREMALGPTHEEVITSLVRDDVQSYKKLPLTMYQIQTKFRDEKRPRFGLLRGREFIMKDAYSFHSTEESLDVKYNEMLEAYSRIFTRLGLEFRTVLADGGSIGGKSTHEFMALSETGEDTIAFSETSPYAANIEIAEVNIDYAKSSEPMRELEKVETPKKKTIVDVATFLNVDPSKIIKTIIFRADDELCAVIVRGDHDINEIKLRKALSVSELNLASESEIEKTLSCKVGTIGPVKLPLEIKVYADNAVKEIVNGICGANEDDFHLKNVNPERDFAVDKYLDLRFIKEGDLSPDGNGTIRFAKGIELGHTFKLGVSYSEAMKATYLDENGNSQHFVMGCYGIGVSRILAAIAEQYNDANGLKWPKKLAPYDIHLITINMNDEIQTKLSNELYHLLKTYRYDILHDDRDERAGVKFTDADLIGLPVRITIGKMAQDGMVEVKFRETGETVVWQKEEITEKLQSFFN
ncbi:proline--tRNA ligase [Sporosarcina thermotolerans]|uniref:Proline--tRNA ligase n=1 Tax=Sporosarcina thermotolerans TaxID=633404 RepID=A0AAW9A988_9BACL|nr:proline--tRNA ligase [Sporosarcina thermotolerans]MDW0115698.1 proline--tRNA ligase [Sporosarcina thermotolerans]